MSRSRFKRWSSVFCAVVFPLAGVVGLSGSAAADEAGLVEGDAMPWVVSLGDSYLSGEGGRWAGNGLKGTDALGSGAYLDGGDRETVKNCHRSVSAPVHVGGGYLSVNFACSGALTTSTTRGGDWKPGVDFADVDGRQGQAAMLRDFARDHDVDVVVLSIGGNDYGFGAVFSECVARYYASSPTLCEDSDVGRKSVSEAMREVGRARIMQSVLNVSEAMRDAGHAEDEWKLIIQTYPVVLTSDFRYPEAGNERGIKGGCPVSDESSRFLMDDFGITVVQDAVWASGSARMVNPGLRVQILDVTGAFAGHELCSRGVHRVQGTGAGVSSWTAVEAADLSEWVVDLSTDNSQACSWNPWSDEPWCGTYRAVESLLPQQPSARRTQESFHPNYWGQLALRNCLRQVVETSDVRARSCAPAGGLNDRSEPNMTVREVVGVPQVTLTGQRNNQLHFVIENFNPAWEWFTGGFHSFIGRTLD